MDVQAITDEFCHNPVFLGAGSNHAGLPMVNTGHCIIQVGKVGCTGIQHGFCLLIGRICMSN